MSQTRLEFEIACDADKGARPYQEDFVKVWRPNRPANGDSTAILAVLADGMGGHVGGSTASQIAAVRYVENFASGYSSADQGLSTIGQLLEHSLIASNDGIGSEIRRNPTLNGMGCTIVAAYLDEQGLRWSSVGDSSLLLYRHSNLIRLNEDHSIGALLDRQAEANLISLEDARNDPRRRTLRSALTGGPIAVQETVTEPETLMHGDWVIVASDGLETLPGDEIARIIARHNELGEPKEVIRELLAEIKKRAVPNQDNVSIIAIKVEDPLDAKTRIVAQDTAPVTPEEESSAEAPDGSAATGKNTLPQSRSRTRPIWLLGAALLFVAVAVFATAAYMQIEGQEKHAASPPGPAQATGSMADEKPGARRATRNSAKSVRRQNLKRIAKSIQAAPHPAE
jgi:protein phosphatase